MSISAGAGPLVEYGQNPPVNPGTAPADYNQDYAPSAFSMGLGLLDPRYGYAIGGAGGGSAAAFIFSPGVNYVVIDQTPATAATANIAALANVTSGTAMTLVSSSGAGVTVMTSSLFLKPTGLTVPISVAIDGLPGFVSFGQSAAIQAFDPTTMIARAVSITGVTSGTGGVFTVRGYSVYGVPMAETITVGAGVNTVNGKKAFKFVTSVTPGFTDAHNYSVGVADVYGLPLRADAFGYVLATFNNQLTTNPTFVAAVTTASTGTSGDTRGTIVATADGTKKLQVMQGVSVAQLAALTPGNTAGLFGVTPYTA